MNASLVQINTVLPCIGKWQITVNAASKQKDTHTQTHTPCNHDAMWTEQWPTTVICWGGVSLRGFVLASQSAKPGVVNPGRYKESWEEQNWAGPSCERWCDNHSASCLRWSSWHSWIIRSVIHPSAQLHGASCLCQPNNWNKTLNSIMFATQHEISQSLSTVNIISPDLRNRTKKGSLPVAVVNLIFDQ